MEPAEVSFEASEKGIIASDSHLSVYVARNYRRVHAEFYWDCYQGAKVPDFPALCDFLKVGALDKLSSFGHPPRSSRMALLPWKN